MLKSLFLKVFRKKNIIKSNRQSPADYWNLWQEIANKSENKWTDWGDHPVILNLIYRDLFGDENTDFTLFLKKEYGWLAGAHVLSLCSGDGSYEKLLVERGVFGRVTGIDIAGERVAKANAIRDPYTEQLLFITGDVNEGCFGNELYEAVFAKSSLHHVENLEKLASGIIECLKPGGLLIAIDYFGPSRFQWTDNQLEAANSFLQNVIPSDLLKKADGGLHEIYRPSIPDMIAMDPSEAVRSSEIMTVIEKQFNSIRIFSIGGTLLHLIFGAGIINNFDENNPEHCSIIEKAYLYEKQLIMKNKIGCDFKFVIAQK